MSGSRTRKLIEVDRNKSNQSIGIGIGESNESEGRKLRKVKDYARVINQDD